MPNSAHKTLQIQAFPLWSLVNALAMPNGSRGKRHESQQSNSVHQCIDVGAGERDACLTDHARSCQLLGRQSVNVSQCEHAMFGS